MALLKKHTTEYGQEIDLYYMITNINLISGIVEIQGFLNKEAPYMGYKAMDRQQHAFSTQPTRQEEIVEEVDVDGVPTMQGTGTYNTVENQDFIAKDGDPLGSIYNFLKLKEGFSDAIDV